MPETKPIPVRLDDVAIARLDRAAVRMGTNRAALMRFLVKTFIDQFEERGNNALPHNWREVMKSMDGRTYGQHGQLRVTESSGGSIDPASAKRRPKVKCTPKRTRR